MMEDTTSMELTYTLIEGGFLIIQDGQPYFKQAFKPGAPGYQKMSPEEAAAAAESYLLEAHRAADATPEKGA